MEEHECSASEAVRKRRSAPFLAVYGQRSGFRHSFPSTPFFTIYFFPDVHYTCDVWCVGQVDGLHKYYRRSVIDPGS